MASNGDDPRRELLALGLGARVIPKVDEPELWESMIPVWGPGKAAVADLQKGDYLGAAINAGLVGLDLVPEVALAKMAMKGAKIVDAGVPVWKAVRARYGRAGVVEKGMHMHHGIFEQNGLIGRHLPDKVKNQLWNLTPLPAEIHGRIHGPYLGAPRFDPITRTWVGMPNWSKAAVAATGARASQAPVNSQSRRR